MSNRPVHVRVGAPFPLILAWAGSVADIPAGYLLCDGRAGLTPDLRDSFVRATTLDDLGVDPDGQDTRDRSHSHAEQGLAAEATHTHVSAGGTATDGSGALAIGTVGGVLLGDKHSHLFPSFTSQHGTSHVHALNSTSFDDETSKDSRPAYYALCYILGDARDLPIGAIAWYAGTLAQLLTATAGSLGVTTSSLGATVGSGTVFTTATLSPGAHRVVLGAEVILVADGTSQPWSIVRGVDGPVSAHPSGTSLDQPSFVICDGADNAPDLVRNGDYLVGASVDFVIGTEGGNFRIDLTGSHSHGAGTVQGDNENAHTHAIEMLGSATGTTSIGTSIQQSSIAAPPDPHGHGNQIPGAQTGVGTAHGHAGDDTYTTTVMVDDSCFPQTYKLAHVMRVA